MKTKIYLIPGTMNDERLWSKLKPFFDDSYELINLDIPIKPSIEAIADAILKKIEEEKINLLGFSLGGYLATYLAIKYANRVKKLFIISSSFNSLSLEEIIQRQKAVELIKKFGFKTLSEKKIKTLLDENSYEDKSLLELIKTMYEDLGEKNFFNQMEVTTKREDLTKKLISLDIPISIFCSTNDRVIDTKYLKENLNKNKNLNFFELHSKSHMLPLEYPKETAIKIKEWIKL